MKKLFGQLTSLLWLLTTCSTSPTDQPNSEDFTTGEKWVWKWNRKVDGEVRAEGEDFQEVVDLNGLPGFWNGMDTLQISEIFEQRPGPTPFRSWPLYVGKKWKYESTWANDEGTTGKTSQDAEVVSLEELEVKAGKFKAYKIAYKGLVTNSRGFKGEMTDTWWYAPELKTYIKHINEDGYGVYVNELVSYSNGK